MLVEYLRKGKQEKEYQSLELIIEELDDVVAFDMKVRFPSVILRKGNKILFARFYTSGEQSINNGKILNNSRRVNKPKNLPHC